MIVLDQSPPSASVSWSAVASYRFSPASLTARYLIIPLILSKTSRRHRFRQRRLQDLRRRRQRP